MAMKSLLTALALRKLGPRFISAPAIGSALSMPLWMLQTWNANMKTSASTEGFNESEKKLLQADGSWKICVGRRLRSLHFPADFFFKHTTTIASQKNSWIPSPSVTGEHNSSGLQTYIVFVHPPSENTPDGRERWYKSFLPTPNSKLIHSYRCIASGFAAELTHEELEEMKKKPGFIGASPDRVRPLLTTHTPDFLGVRGASNLWNVSNLGQSIIDTGVSPTHPSFNDQGMPPPPTKWIGACQFNKCNNKLIGARNMVQGLTSRAPFDDDGHVTHTASTTAGMFVNNANILGQAIGTAAGMAPVRQRKAAKIFPRPTAGSLRPIVQCQTLKHNMKPRAGRGFTLEELKSAGIPKKLAPTIGIAVDHRRKNRSLETRVSNPMSRG